MSRNARSARDRRALCNARIVLDYHLVNVLRVAGGCDLPSGIPSLTDVDTRWSLTGGGSRLGLDWPVNLLRRRYSTIEGDGLSEELEFPNTLLIGRPSSAIRSRISYRQPKMLRALVRLPVWKPSPWQQSGYAWVRAARRVGLGHGRYVWLLSVPSLLDSVVTPISDERKTAVWDERSRCALANDPRIGAWWLRFWPQPKPLRWCY